MYVKRLIRIYIVLEHHHKMKDSKIKELESEERRNDSNCRRKCYMGMRQNSLVILTLIGCGVGFMIGLLVKPEHPSSSAIMWIGMPGELYIRMIKMMVIPLVICSIIAGTAKMDPRTNGKVGGVFIAFIMVTNFLTPVFAAVLSSIIRPGIGVESVVDDSELNDNVMETEDIFADLLRNIVPDNIVASCFQQSQTMYEYDYRTVSSSNGTHNTSEVFKEVKRKYVGTTDSTNVLGLIIVSVGFGITAATMKEEAEPFLSFFKSATEIIMKILNILMWTTPVGVASLTAETILLTDDVEKTFTKLGYYFLTVELGLAVWGFIIVPGFFFLVHRTNPFKFYGTIMPSIMIEVVTASDMIALPESVHSLEIKNGCDSRLTRLLAPLAATIGRAGSVYYIACSCFFIMQTQGREMTPSDSLVIVLLAWISALAIPAVSGASLVTVLILLTALGVPGEATAMLFAFEFFLDRSRGVVNLLTELTGVMFVNKIFKASLQNERASTNDANSQKKCAENDRRYLLVNYTVEVNNSNDCDMCTKL